MNQFIHETAIIEDDATIGEHTKIWHWTHICSGARAVLSDNRTKCFVTIMLKLAETSKFKIM